MVTQYVVLTLLAAQSVASRKAIDDNKDDFNTRIYYGEDAEKDEFPFMVRLSDKGINYCGAALIRPRVVLTAGHCLYLEGELVTEYPTVIVGDFNLEEEDDTEQYLEVARIIPHPEYDDETLENDLALIILKEDVYTTEEGPISTIALPEDSRLYETGTPITVIGWGETEDTYEPPILQKHEYEISDQDACKDFWKTAEQQPIMLHDGMVCTGKPPLEGHAWVGDSGGPLFTQDGDKFVLLALTSWGVDEVTPYSYDVNTNVFYYLDWIKEHLDESSYGQWIELQGGQNHGIVLLSDHSGTSTICNDGVGQDEINAVCRHLGYSYGILKHLADYQTGRKNKIKPDLPGFGKTNMNCRSDTKNISECTFDRYPAEVPCFEGQQLAVQCADSRWGFQVTALENKITTSSSGAAKGKVSCTVEANKYDLDIDLENEVEVALLNVMGEGEVEVELVADMRYKRKMNVFLTKIKSQQQVEHRCFACVAVLRHSSDFFTVRTEDERCKVDVEPSSLLAAVRSLLQSEEKNEN